jgi:hypothetical protein
MIRESIEPGTKVWHEVYGIGKFQSFKKGSKLKCVVKFDNTYPIIVMRKALNEIEGEN